MQKLYLYLRANGGAQATLVNESNSFVGNNLPSFARGQKVTFDIGLFLDEGDTLATQAALNLVADSWDFCADSEYAQATPAIQATSVTLETTGHLTVVIDNTNSTRMGQIKDKVKTLLHGSLIGKATGSQTPVFVAIFDFYVHEPVTTAGL